MQHYTPLPYATPRWRSRVDRRDQFTTRSTWTEHAMRGRFGSAGLPYAI